MRERLTRLFASRGGIVAVGAVIGLLAPLLQRWGNPPNMGICVACFERDIAGALGLHRAAAVQYIRPEIIGLVLGSTIAALLFREFRARSGSAPIVRYVLGVFAMIGALAFLGCPWRALLRLAGGDLNALVGLLGFVCGIYVGVLALKSGYNPGRAYPQPQGTAFIYPVVLAALLAAVALRPQFIFFSAEGPGSMAAPVLASLGAGLVVGILAQRSRLCLAGGFRDMILIRDPHLLWGFTGIFAAALIGNIALGKFNLGFANQPIAHTAHLWNFLGLAVVGFAAVLAGGCPLRQLIMAGEGDTDAVLTVLGMVAGAAFAHNFGLAASGAGATANGKAATIVGLIVVAVIGLVNMERVQAGLKGEMSVGS